MKKTLTAVALLAAGSALAWTTLAPRVEAGGAEYGIAVGRLTYNGAQTTIPATLVGICEDGSVWVLARANYGSRSFRWGRVVANFAEDPLLAGQPSVRWSQSLEC